MKLNIKKHLVDFFDPPKKSYRYKIDPGLLVKKIKLVLHSPTTLMGERDIKGYFDRPNVFKMYLSPSFGIWSTGRSVLTGKIKELFVDKAIEIELTYNPALNFYLIFFITIMVSITCFVQLFILEKWIFLLMGVLVISGGPGLIFMFSKASHYALLDRYDRYIDHELSNL